MGTKKLRLDTSSFVEEGGSSNSATPSPSPSTSGVFGGSVGLGGTAAGGPYRGKYTRPLIGIGGGYTPSTTSRYSPYSISRDRPIGRRSVPLIRAKRDDNPGGSSSSSSSRSSLSNFNPSMNFGSTTSTAQKIMETLASMSTPVLNAGRVRIDSIKPIKPMQIGSSSVLNSSSVLFPSSKFTGPPKTLSPLLVPKTPTGIRDLTDKGIWGLKYVSGIPPKMVDCGCNTDDSLLNSIIEKKMNSSTGSPGGGGSVSRPLLALPSTTNTNELIISRPRGTDMWKDKNRLVNGGEFVFSSPWTLKELDDYVGQRKSNKSNKCEPISVVGDNGIKPILTNGGGSKSPTNYQEFKKDNSFSSTNFASFKSSNEKKWECPACMVFNGLKDSKCVCCSTPKPGQESASVTPASSFDSTDNTKILKASSKWNCDVCLVPNEATAASCVCCTNPNPNKLEKSPAKKQIPGSWKCVVCGSNKNGFILYNCEVCASPRPKELDPDYKPEEKPKTDLKFEPMFGFKSSGTTETATTFGMGNTVTTTSTPTVLTVPSFSGSTQPFTFGTPINAASPSKRKIDETPGEEDSSKKFSFGATGPSSSSSNFTFGFTPSASVTPASSFDSTDNTKILKTSKWNCDVCLVPNEASAASCVCCTNPNPNKLEKSASPAKKQIPGSWKCVVCGSNKNGFNLYNCQVCASPRPNELDPDYKPEEKPKTDLKFEPVFGFKSSGTTETATITPTFGMSNTVTTTSTPTVMTVPTSFSTPGTGSTQPFTFGTPINAASPSKRKIDETPGEGDSSKKFSFGAAGPSSSSSNFTFGSTSSNTTPQLKLIEPIPSQVSSTVTSAASNAPGSSNNAGFLEALKNASAAVKASTEKQSNAVTSTSGPASSKVFQFGSPAPVVNSGMVFGALPSSNPPPPFSFGSSNTSGSTFASTPLSYNQGNPPQNIAPPIATPAPAATPFNFNFGASAPTPATTFNFGAAAPTPATTFNFGATSNANAAPGTAPPPTLFQFSSTGTNAPGGGIDAGGRKIRKAMRRARN